MNLRLIFNRNGRRTVIPLRKAVSVLGRAHGNTVRIPSAEVSRRHCRLMHQDGLVTVEDMESVNGTFLNGRRLKNIEQVRPGDEIELGPVKFLVEYDLTPEARAHLRDNENPADLLQALADGEAVDADDLPELEILDDPLGVGGDVEPIDVEPVSPRTSVLEPGENDYDFDATPWQMPDGGDLRDLLAEIEDEEPTSMRKPAPGKKPKKRRD